MSENKDVFEFLSRCWVPFIASEHISYYAYGNTPMLDFLRDFKVSREMDILVLGLGDVRHVMKTVAGLSQRPPSSAGQVKEIRFHLNDDDQDVIARDIILLEIMNKLDPESKSDVEFLWSVWYNAFMVEKNFTRLNALLEDLIDKYSNSSRDSERICKIGDKQSLKSLLETWNCWLKRKLNQSAVKQSRLKSIDDDCKAISFTDFQIAKYAAMQIYIDRGIKESDVETLGKEMLTATRDGFINFSENRKDRNVFVNPTLMRPGCEEWRVDETAFAARCYLPFQKEFFDKHSTIYEACFEKMRETISSYVESWKVVKVTYTFWATDLFHLCHWLMPSDVKFDFIFTSNLMDHVGLINLLLITQPRLKNYQSVVLTEALNWNQHYKTFAELFQRDLVCNCMLLPSIIGLKMTEDLDLGISNLQGFYRTMYGRPSDIASIYWTKSLNQENVRIDLEASPGIQISLILLVISTFWNKQSMISASSLQQTPLGLMYCFQRLQHLIRGGMATLLDYVEFKMNERSMDLSRNRMTWDVVCWAFGQKHERDQLCIVKIPFKDLNSFLAAMKRHCKWNCRLMLEYDTSGNKEEVLSLFQYDAVESVFRVPILESAWKALPDNTTMTVIDGVNDNSPYLHKLRNLKVPFKREGIVMTTYTHQPKGIDVGATDQFQFIINCSEDAEMYRMENKFAEDRAALDFLCELIVSDCNTSMVAESTTVVKSPHKFSCAVDSYEIKNVDDNQIQVIFYKQKTFNTGRTALPYRLIDDSELLPFTSGQDIKNYLDETMICDLMFCSPTDIESRAKAFRGPVLLTDDAFLALRLVIEQLWHLGSKKEKTLPHLVRVELQEQNKTSPVMILDVEGYYMYYGLPLVKMKFMELDRNSAALKTNKETITIYAKYQKSLELLKKMLLTNSIRMSQERPAASVNMTASYSPSINTFLQMVFANDIGEEMASAIHIYPLNTDLLKSYIEKIYSASIRQNFLALVKGSDMQKQVKERMSSLSAKVSQFPSGEHKSLSTVTMDSSSLPLKIQASCSECNKFTTDLKKCIRCKSVSYCSKECQVKDWSKHKRKCSSALLKAQDGSAMKKSNESGCSIKAENIKGSSLKPTIQDCATNEPRINVPSSTKKMENDLLTKAKLEDCSFVESSSEDSFIVYRRESKSNSDEDSALKPKPEYYISNSKNDDSGASAKIKDEDHFSTMEANDAISYLESAFADSAKAYNSSMQSTFQANQSAKKTNEVGSPLKAMNPSHSHLQEIKVQNDAVADSSLGPRSSKVCMCCRSENSNMKKCTQCKNAAY